MVEITSESEEMQKREEIVQALVTIQGIERGGAGRLADMAMKAGYKDLKALQQATKEDLLKVKGIGTNTAEKIVLGLEALSDKGSGDGEGEEKKDDAKAVDKKPVKAGGVNVGHFVDDIVKRTRHVVDITMDRTRNVVEKTRTTVDSKIIKPVKPRLVPIDDEDDDIRTVVVEAEEIDPEKERAVKEFRSVQGVNDDDANRLYEMGYTGLKDLVKKTLKG